MTYLICPSCGSMATPRPRSWGSHYCLPCLARYRALIAVREAADLGAPMFQIDLRTLGTTSFVDVAGELDLATTPRLRRAVEHVDESDAKLIVIDLLHVTFIDAAGVRALLDAGERLGSRLRLLPAADGPQRIFALTDTHDALPFVDREPEQLATYEIGASDLRPVTGHAATSQAV